MNFSEEWKSLFPIGSIFTPPLLSSSSSSSELGPLLFNPNPKTLTKLFKSPALSPPLLSPLPPLSLSRFLSTSSPDSPIPYSTSSSIASNFGIIPRDDTVLPLHYNRLQFLQCVDKNIVLVFFTTGDNHDQIGYLLVSVKDSTLFAEGNENGDVFTAKNLLNHRIVRILVSPVDDIFGFEGNESLDTDIVGCLMAVTGYSVHWFSVKINNSSTERHAVLSYLGLKLFKSSLIVGASWSPHLPAECVVLLESGALFLFDLESCLESNKQNPTSFKGTRLKVKWGDSVNSENSKWLGCEFSWHPRILIVACTDAVYLVDMREDMCNVTCLMNIEVLRLYCSIENEKFLGLSSAASDSFHFIVASNSLLVLCDVRKPMLPVLQWAHCLDKPCYIDVFRLSNLRSHSRDETYKKGTELGFGIIVGSFLSCEFGLFCYGPPLPARKGSVASEITKFCKSWHAWELPSDLWLSGRGCHCGSCIVREEFFKDTLPEWVDWQQKKELVLGFGILDNDLSAVLSEPDEFGGFTLIRLMSSGKLEAQRYCASWDLVKKSEVAHKELKLDVDDTLLYSIAGEDYKFPKRFKYLNLDYLYGHLDDNLAGVLDLKMKKSSKGHRGDASFCQEFHEVLCQKLKICGYGRFRTAPAISVVFDDINLPTSVREVALRRAWSDLPMELLQLAFSSYVELLEVLLDQKKVSLEFLVVPELPQLPPFFLRKPSCRSSKWSQRVQPGDTLVGPVLPLPILLTLHEFCNGCPNSQNEVGYSSEVELSLQCNEVKQVAKEMAVADSGSELHDDRAVSLADDEEQMSEAYQKPKSFVLYHPAAFNGSVSGHAEGSEVFSTMISKVCEKDVINDRVDAVGLEAFDDLCPFKLKFDSHSTDFKSQESKAYNMLKRQFSRWQESFSPYRSFCSRSKLQWQDS